MVTNPGKDTIGTFAIFSMHILVPSVLNSVCIPPAWVPKCY